MSRGYMLRGAFFTIVVVGAIAAAGAYKRSNDMEGPGRAYGAVLARDGDKASVILFDEISHGRASYESRLLAIDATTGARRAMRRVDQRGAVCATDASGKLWCTIQNEPRGVNPLTLEDATHGSAPPPMPSLTAPWSCQPIYNGMHRASVANGRVERLGTKSWTAPADGECQLITYYGDMLLVAFDAHTRLVAYDLANGEERWRVKF